VQIAAHAIFGLSEHLQLSAPAISSLSEYAQLAALANLIQNAMCSELHSQK
jgi:hypothetical protein